ncbi:MAG: RsmE family RNA methyltransferase [Aquificae bacterium]|nr:RsmE family RNA methyltransferase [Aquificota bacterium]
MHVFISEEKRGNYLLLEEGEYRHFKVRRIEKKEEIGVIFGGRIYRCLPEREEGKRVWCRVLGELPTREPPREITVYQCVPAELKTMDQIVRQLTEVGVKKLVPVLSERSFRKKEVLEKRREKWERIVREAMKQSRRPLPLELGEPRGLEDIEPLHELSLFLDNFSEGKSPKELKLPEEVGFIVGPEGGFSEREAKLLRDKGFVPVLLRPYVMRSETACVVFASMLLNC